MTDCVPSSHGLVFSISPVKKALKKKNEEEEEENILTLAPFTKPPKINFGQLKINESVERSVLLINPQQFDLDLMVTNKELDINNIQLCIEKGKNVNLKIAWSPEKPGNYKFAILFEVTNSARLKFLVHAFGVCIKPEEKKPIRKPLNMLQPLKKEKKPEPAPIQKKETLISTSTKYKTTTTTTTTIFKKSAGQAKNVFDETVVIEKNNDKENKKHLGLKIEGVSETLIKKDLEIRHQKTLYDESFSEETENNFEPIALEAKTPKLMDIMQSHSSANLTPKLSDFVKPTITFDQDQTFTSASITKITTIAATKLIDIGIDQENPINNKTSIDFSKMPKTPNFSFKYNSFLNESIAYPTQNENLTSTVNRLGINYDLNNLATPKFDRNFLYTDDSTIMEFDTEKYAIMVQRAWRYKIFRRKLREMKLKIKTEKLNELLAGSKGLAMEFELLNKKQDELVVQQQLEKQRKEALLAEMERQEQEKKDRLLKCVLVCQRAIRIKRFRKFFIEHKRKMILKACLTIQRKWRIIKFRQSLRMLKHQEKIRIEYENKLLECAIFCQRVFRYKKFHCSLKILREQRIIQNRRNSAAIMIQKNWKMLKFRRQMLKWRQSAIRIQNWYRQLIKPRRDFIILRNSAIRIQYLFRKRMAKKIKSVLLLQSVWRSYVIRKDYVKIQTSVLKIQQWFRSKTDRIHYIKLKRSLPRIQQKSRELIRRQNAAATIIQKTFHFYKFRQSMAKYRTAAIKIQAWSRSMKTRYEFLIKRRVTIKSTIIIQTSWRVFMAKEKLKNLKIEKKQTESAVMIQKLWRSYQAKKTVELIKQQRLEEIKKAEQMTLMVKSAIRIQSAWRGFKVRKTTTQALSSIRSRLSFYQVNTSSESNATLGSRIINSLKILKYPYVPIQQIILALTDLDKVTRLSPECCLIFTREGAIDILYTFILNCNRSVPHMDLVKLCLQILINLSKYSQTVEYILQPSGSCLLLLNLLQAYQSSNPNIFMDACIIFIILSQNESIKQFILRQENLIKKVNGIHSVLARRATFNRERQVSKGCFIGKDQLNSTLNVGLSTGAKKSLLVEFSFSPDWSLAKKSTIELIDPLGALEHMMDSLGIVAETSSGVTLSSKTPKKSLSSSAIDKSGKKSITKTKQPAKPVQSKLATKQLFQETKAAFIEEENKADENNEDLYGAEFDEDHFSIISNESYRSVSSVTTVKSISNLNCELPKLNSTVMSSSGRKYGTLKKSESINFP